MYRTLAGLTVLLLAASGCEIDKEKSEALLETGIKTGAEIHTRVTVASAQAQGAPAELGSVQAAGLLSLKYYIKSLGICQTANIQGTGFGMGPNCIILYETEPDAKYEQPGGAIPDATRYKALMNTARTDDNPNFIDLMSAQSRARMARTVTLTTEDAGEYQYGYVYWHYPIKLKAEVTLGDGTTIYSHDGEPTSFVDGNNYTHIISQSGTPLTTGPADEAVVLQQNGGTWFKFQTPFTVSADDITNGTSFKLALSFNPNGVVQAGGPNAGVNALLQDSPPNTPGYGFELPILDLSPVVSREGETAVRESYLFPVSTATGNQFDIRYDLYYVQERPLTILAVETKTLVTAQTTAPIGSGWSVSFVVTEPDGALTFEKWDHSPILTGFKRAAAAGETATATLHCDGSSDPRFSWCGAAGTLALTGSLTGVIPLAE